MAQFMLLLHDKPSDLSTVSAEDIQGIVGEYIAWRQGLEEQGRLVGGENWRTRGANTCPWSTALCGWSTAPTAKPRK